MRNIAVRQRLLRQALAAFHREDEDRALPLLRKLVRLDPGNLRVLYLTALCANLVTDEEALEDAVARARRIDRRHPLALACEATRYLYLSNFSRAESLFERALAALPEDVDLLLGLGILYEYSDDKSKGAEAFRMVLDLDPKNIRARIALGTLRALEGDYHAALEEYRRAKEVDPSLENPHQRLGRDYYYEGMIDEARSEFGQAVAEEPDEPAAWFYLLDCCRRLERTDEALDTYAEIQQRFGDDPEITSGFFEHFNMQTDAIASLEQYSRRSPDDPAVLLRLSRVYREAGRGRDAVRAAERSVRLSPDNADALTHLADLYLALEEFEHAIAAADRAIALNGNAQSAYQAKADALLFLGRQEESHAVILALEQARDAAWREYQAKFSGQDLDSSDVH